VKKTAAKAPARKRSGVRTLQARDVASLKHELARRAPRETPRFHADPDDVQRSVARLVLAVVEFLRKLLERQAIRRMDEGTLTGADIEKMGRALMQLEETVHDLAARFGLTPDELNLELGPLGRLH
jgi:hypothetical protein